MITSIIQPQFFVYDILDNGYINIFDKYPTGTAWEVRRRCRYWGMKYWKACDSFAGDVTPALKEARFKPWTAYRPRWYWASAGRTKYWPPHPITIFHFTLEEEMDHFLVLWRLGK